MSTLFLDTSALAKRYVVETGSKWIRRQVQPSGNNTIVISALAIVEICSVLARQEREGRLTPKTSSRLRKAFFKHAATEYIVIPMDNTLFVHASDLVALHPLRTLDAIQLASALESSKFTLQSPTFIGADLRLLSVAMAEGLQIHDANAFP